MYTYYLFLPRDRLREEGLIAHIDMHLDWLENGTIDFVPFDDATDKGRWFRATTFFDQLTVVRALKKVISLADGAVFSQVFDVGVFQRS